MKAKKNYRRKQGHRQPYTKVEITGIKTSAKKAATTKKKAVRYHNEPLSKITIIKL